MSALATAPEVRLARVERAVLEIRALAQGDGAELVDFSDSALADELFHAGGPVAQADEKPVADAGRDDRRQRFDPSLDGVLLARRVSYEHFPEPEADARFPYARNHPAHRDRTNGEITASLRASVAWQEEMAVPLAARDVARRLTADGRKKRGPASVFSFEETEVMELYRRVCGATSTDEAFFSLARFEAARDRRLLGFDRERFRPRRGEKWRRRQPGIPSAATMSKYRTELGEDFRDELWDRFLQRITRDYVAENPVRVLHFDGTNIPIQGVAPIVDQDGVLRNDPMSITVPEAGFQTRYRVKKGGHGFNAVILADELGVPLASSLERIQTSERDMAIAAIGKWNEQIRPAYPSDELRVAVADSGFTSPAVRDACRRAGMIENIHHVSHGKKDTSQNHARRQNKRRIAIENSSTWALNGHRELVPLCGCGRATQERRAWLDRHGVAHTRLKGRCDGCGSSITLKSGRYRTNTDSGDPRVYYRTAADDLGKADYLTGNPLTYNDPAGKIYGAARFARNEGMNGILASYYKLNGKPRRWRTRRQVQREMTMVFAVMVGLAIQGRQAEAATVPSARAA